MMLRFHVCVILLLAGTLGGVVGRAGLALGDDFRVDNAVYIDDQKEPTSESTTFFHEGVVYDCMRSPAETVVFNRTAGQFVLLNHSGRIRAELTTAQVTAFVNRLQPLAAKQKDPLVRFLADPKFDERFDPSRGELSFSSPLVTYRAVLSEENPAAVEQYREFSDWYARLNAMLTPGSRPPFGRLVVNAAIARRKAIASQVTLTLASSKSGGKPSTIRSTHDVVRSLTPTDLERVAQLRELMSRFKLESFDKYRKSGVK